MRKLLSVFVLAFVLFSCKNEIAEKKPDPLCYPTEVTRTESNSPDVISLKYTYNAENQVVREEVLKNNALERYSLFSYNAIGNLHKKRNFGNTGLFLEQDEILYNPENIAVKLLHSYIDANGTPSLHHYRAYVFNAEGKITKWTDFAPDNEAITSRTYVYKSNDLVESVGIGSKDEFMDKIEQTFDANKNPFSATRIHVVSFPGNELKQELKGQNGQVLRTSVNTFTYNEKGYPVKRTQIQADGTIKTETFVYRQE